MIRWEDHWLDNFLAIVNVPTILQYTWYSTQIHIHSRQQQCIWWVCWVPLWVIDHYQSLVTHTMCLFKCWDDAFFELCTDSSVTMADNGAENWSVSQIAPIPITIIILAIFEGLHPFLLSNKWYYFGEDHSGNLSHQLMHKIWLSQVLKPRLWLRLDQGEDLSMSWISSREKMLVLGRPDLTQVSLDYSSIIMAGSLAPYIHVILAYVVSITITQPLVRWWCCGLPIHQSSWYHLRQLLLRNDPIQFLVGMFSC